MNPLISIIIPIYNVGPYLQRCVDSVLAQTQQNLDIILVDDGSTDGCPALCDRYAELDQRVRVVHQANGGLSAARNAGLDRARGELIAFVDSDDWIERDMMENLMRNMALHRSDIAVCNVYIIREGEKRSHPTHDLPPRLHSRDAMGALALDKQLQSWMWNKLYRRCLFSDLRFPENRLFEDYHVMHHLFHRADWISMCKHFGYNYVQREGSIMNSQSLGMRMAFCDCRLARLHFFQHHYPHLVPVVEESLRAELRQLLRYAEENPLHFLEEGADRLPFYQEVLCDMDREADRKRRKQFRPQASRRESNRLSPQSIGW